MCYEGGGYSVCALWSSSSERVLVVVFSLCRGSDGVRMYVFVCECVLRGSVNFCMSRKLMCLFWEGYELCYGRL